MDSALGDGIGIGVFVREEITPFGISYRLMKVQQSTNPRPFPMLMQEFILWHRQEVIEQEKKVFASRQGLTMTD